MSAPAFVSTLAPAFVLWLALLLLYGPVIAQSGGLRAPAVVTQGGTFEVEVGTGDASVEVSTPGPGSTKSYPVPPGKKVTIPVPPVPGGTILIVKVGRRNRATIVLVEVIAP